MASRGSGSRPDVGRCRSAKQLPAEVTVATRSARKSSQVPVAYGLRWSQVAVAVLRPRPRGGSAPARAVGGLTPKIAVIMMWALLKGVDHDLQVMIDGLASWPAWSTRCIS